jgi:hypothetical protein
MLSFARRYIAFGLLLPAVAACQTSVKQSTLVGAKPVADSTNTVQVTFDTAPSQVIQGSAFSLVADIQNTTSSLILIDLDTVYLAVQPELAPPSAVCEWFYPASYEASLPSKIYLQPGDHLTVFFNAAEKTDANTWNKYPTCRANWWGRVLKRLDFLPGSYSFLLRGTYYSNLPTATTGGSQPQASTGASLPAPASASGDEHFFSASANLPVAIDQTQIILYAAIGGLLAWLVMTFRSSPTPEGQPLAFQQRLVVWIGVLRKIAAAMLVSVTVTIVASRLSATSFPVKVSVDDFWGALTVGFVSYFIGGKFIDRLADSVTSTSSAPLAASLAAPVKVPDPPSPNPSGTRPSPVGPPPSPAASAGSSSA